MPKNTNILMVRHAEKPDSGNDLSVAGQERAHAYAVYFQNYVLNGTLLGLDYIFATADSSQSQRPRLTMEPLAEAMGMKIRCQISGKRLPEARGRNPPKLQIRPQQYPYLLAPWRDIGAGSRVGGGRQ